MKHLLQSRINHPGVWHAQGLREATVISSGHVLLDSALPDGGWQTEVVYEAATEQHYALLTTLQSTLSQLSQKYQWLILINPPRWVLEFLSESDPLLSNRLLIVRGKAELDTLWATEQALQQRNAACILAWPDVLVPRDVQRLKLAARGSKALCFVFPIRANNEGLGSQLQVRAHQAQLPAQVIVLPDLLQQSAAINDNLH